ncbi:MAG: hypothetical protein ABIO71_05770 [Caldimonas sp.]
MATSTAAQTSSLDGTDSTTLQKLREQTDAVVQRLRPQIDAVSAYTREEPTKALLISAAAGAALMALIALLARSNSPLDSARAVRDDARDSAGSALSVIRSAALDLADRAQSAANDALGATQKYAADAQKRATDTADSVSSGVADAWQSLRDQAGPVVDKLRPQFDAAAAYAKAEPARTALGVAAAGAVVVGLMALIRRSEA